MIASVHPLLSLWVTSISPLSFSFSQLSIDCCRTNPQISVINIIHFIMLFEFCRQECNQGLERMASLLLGTPAGGTQMQGGIIRRLIYSLIPCLYWVTRKLGSARLGAPACGFSMENGLPPSMTTSGGVEFLPEGPRTFQYLVKEAEATWPSMAQYQKFHRVPSTFYWSKQPQVCWMQREWHGLLDGSDTC